MMTSSIVLTPTEHAARANICTVRFFSQAQRDITNGTMDHHGVVFTYTIYGVLFFVLLLFLVSRSKTFLCVTKKIFTQVYFETIYI